MTTKRRSTSRRVLRMLVLVVALALLNVLPAVTAQAAEPETITFKGAGWGHGVGMSQYGAYSRAADGGQTYEQILAAYYQGATLGSLGVAGIPTVDSLHTNVASDITSTVVYARPGPGTGEGIIVTLLTDGEEDPTATLVSRSGSTPDDHVTITDTTPDPGNPDGCQITVTIDGVDTDWGIGPCDLDFTLTSAPDDPAYLVEATNCRRTNDCTYGWGTMFRIVDNGSDQRSVPDKIGSGGCSTCPEYQGFDLVVETTADEYTRGIAEVPFSWPTHALRTQAVAARSYAASFAVSNDHTAVGCFCDVRNDSSYQVFAGWLGDRELWTAWNAAATATSGQVVTHPAAPDRDIVRAYYSSSNGGATEWVKEKWGSDLPYLLSVPDPWSLTPANPRADWEFTFDVDVVVDRVWGASSENRLISAEVIATNTSGSAKTVRFTAVTPDDQQVSKDLSVGSVVSAFGLYSWYFTIDDAGVIAPPPSGSDTVAMQDPRTGIWTLRYPDGAEDAFYYGNPLDIPYIGDWNGNGTETVGLYRESTGFLFLRLTNDQGVADIQIYYGNPGDKPIAGDWDGDGIDTVGIYRPSQAKFYLRNSNTQGVGDVEVVYGNPSDIPLAGDWDGDGIDSIGVYRPSTRTLYLVNDVNTPTADIEYFYQGAASGDRVVVGDWNGDGIDTVGVFRPSTRTWYLRDTFEQASANIVFEFGEPWMNPVAGFWGN